MAKVAKPNPLAELATRLVERLQRPADGWLTRSQWTAELSAEDQTRIAEAVTSKPAKGQIVFAIPNDPDSLVLLKDQIERFAADPQVLLRLAREPVDGCSAVQPVRLLTDLTAPLEPKLKKLMDAHWSAHSASFPTGLAALRQTVGKKTALAVHDERFPRPELVLSQKLVESLKAMRTAGETQYPTDWVTLIRHAGIDASDKSLPVAVESPPFKNHVKPVRKVTQVTWVAFSEDIDRVVESEGFLQRLLHTTCTADIPEVKLKALSKQLPQSLQLRFFQVWKTRAGEGRTVSFATMKAGKTDVLFRDARFPQPEVRLAADLVRTLQTQKGLGGISYPTSLNQLIQLAQPNTPPELVKLAIACPAFASRVKPIRETSSDAWMAFADDVDRIIESAEFLQELLHEACSPETPEVKLSVLTKRLPLAIRPKFLEAWKSHVGQGKTCAFATLAAAGKDFLVRDSRFPRPEVRLADDLVRVLQSQKSLGGMAYPTTWNRLLQLTQPDAPPAIVKQALQLEPFRSRVVSALVGSGDSPLGFVDDLTQLAGSSQLLEWLLSKSTSESVPAVSVEKLVKVKGLNPTLRPLVEAELERQLGAKRLPNGLGALRIGGKWQLFRLRDAVLGSQSAVSHRAPETVPEPAKPTFLPAETNFARDFEAAFDKLNAISRLPGTVSLVDLRPVFNRFSREQFDSEFSKLRREGRYSLSVVEGRHGLTTEERDACLVIDGDQYLLVRKR